MTPTRWQRLASAVSSVLDTPGRRSKALRERLSGQSILSEALSLVADYELTTGSAPAKGAESAPLLANGQHVGDRYIVQSFLGRGGMGEVYAAWDEVVQVQVALKLFADDGL